MVNEDQYVVSILKPIQSLLNQTELNMGVPALLVLLSEGFQLINYQLSKKLKQLELVNTIINLTMKIKIILLHFQVNVHIF